MASTKRAKGGSGGGGGGGRKTGERPKLRSSHASAGAPAPRAGAPKNAAKQRARRVVEGVTAAARRDEAKPREPAAPREPKPAKKKALLGETTSTASDGARNLAVLVAVEALEKKAVGLEILDVAGRVDYADFLVLMSGRSDRHVVALAQGIEEALKKKGHRPISVEGLPHATWVLIDFGDVVVHVFQEDRRHLYNLEGLWMDARRIPLPAEQPS